MPLTQLTLHHFRCFEKLIWEPQQGLNFIVGPNAQGKTSLLEAACVLLRMKSPRTHHVAEMLRFGEHSFCLEGIHDHQHQQKLVISPEEKPPYRLFLDDVLQREKKEYLSQGCVVWFGNDDVSMVNDSGERRRRFLDSAGLQVGTEYRRLLRTYEKALRSRNLLLREQRPRQQIDAYSFPLAESGDQLIGLRQQLIDKLAPLIAVACRKISCEDLLVTYQPGATHPMLEALAASRSAEERLRFTQVGPHRDDLVILLNGIPASAFASEGQRRTIALSLKLGLADFLTEEENDSQRSPLLLLDDIFGELDLTRRNALLENLPKRSQAFFTTTALEKIELPEKATLFHLSKGRVSLLK